MTLTRRILTALLCCISFVICHAEMPFDENLKTPAISSKHSHGVVRHMESIRKKFVEKGLETKTMRNGEVLVVTISADQLFPPNETKLTPEGAVKLSYFRQAVIHPESYRLVVAVYADDTADTQYSENLTHQRANAVKAEFEKVAEGSMVLNMNFYWFGNSKYLLPNNSIANRAKNRRVEVYIVPEAHIIEASQAK